MVHIKEPLRLIGKSSPCGGSGFPRSLSEWVFFFFFFFFAFSVKVDDIRVHWYLHRFETVCCVRVIVCQMFQ